MIHLLLGKLCTYNVSCLIKVKNVGYIGYVIHCVRIRAVMYGQYGINRMILNALVRTQLRYLIILLNLHHGMYTVTVHSRK